MRKLEALVLGTNHIVFTPGMYALLKEDFQIPAETWVQGPFGRRVRKKYNKSLFTKNKGNYVLPQGFLSKVKKIIKEREIDCIIDGEEKFPCKLETLDNVEYRGIQKDLLKKALKSHRGVLRAYTSFGKTITAAAIFKSYLTAHEGKRGIFIAHTQDLIFQSAEEFRKFGLDVGVWQGQTKEDGQVICATRQTLANIDPKELKNKFFVVIRDEVHRSGNQYKKLMESLACPIRYGLTATLPNTPEALAEVEGSIGPVLGEVTIQDGTEHGLLAIPSITMLNYDSTSLEASSTFQGIYYESIVKNKGRNSAIVGLAKKFMERGESSLIFIRDIEHGENIEKMLNKEKIKNYFVHGKSDKAYRLLAKKKLEEKEVFVVICSTIWNEGVSIKSLNNCIVGVGYKDEKMVLQIVGRGTRIDTGKFSVKIWDFLDPQKYLSTHTILRMQTYAQNGWDVCVKDFTKI